MPAAACALLQAWLAEAGLTTTAAAKSFVFVLGNPARGGGAVDHSKALGAPRWTEVVKAVLKRQAGVAFAPKDLRSSFVTFLLSNANPDEALKKAVAQAMRHSTALQGSATYDRGGVSVLRAPLGGGVSVLLSFAPTRSLLCLWARRRDHAAVVHSSLRARHRAVQARIDAGGPCGGS